MIWDMKSLSHERTLEGHGGVVRSVAFGGARLVSCSQDLSLRVWDVGSGRCEGVLEGHEEDVRGVGVSSDGGVCVSCSFDKSVRVWSLESMKEVSRMEGHSDKVFGVAVSGSGQRAVSCSWDMTVRVWDVGRGRALGCLSSRRLPSLCTLRNHRRRRRGCHHLFRSRRKEGS